ncbi:hypothetical protein [Dyadobacter aurulentus]|uniref:hypothetical protein n=1 Tax=Dyadobacter sp. UC 10 TaxID=2605428 RepID=UPI0011F14554|nr:hypothetical protein [Dyadobacter sp. UC 10]KAA0990967.1 hypothetical protein FXO21_12785 [Dyadobacter sp. UC 10]
MKNSKSWLSTTLVSACFASALVLSSCSKEQSVEPVTEKVQSPVGEPTLRVDPPKYSPTNGQPGIGANIGQWWTGIKPGNSIFAVSTTNHLGGDPSKSWITPLPAPAPGVTTFLTTSTGLGEYSQGVSSYYSGMISNLIDGKKYKITFKVASSSVDVPVINGAQFAKSAKIILEMTKNDCQGFSDYDGFYKIEKVVDLTNKPGQWVTETITFTATKHPTYFVFRNNTPTTAKTFVNLHIGAGAVQIDNPQVQQL